MSKHLNISIETLKKTKGIGSKTLERIIEQHKIDNEIRSFKSEYKPSDKYKTDKDINLWQGDCIELMHHIPDKSIDMILTDLPYGTTACSWDEIIPFEPLWSHYKRIIKDNGAVVLFGSEPFSTKIRKSNMPWYRYDWVWNKKLAGNAILAKKQPLKIHENIIVFSKKSHNYNPQMIKREKKRWKLTNLKQNEIWHNHSSPKEVYNNLYYPNSIIEFGTGHMRGNRLHPTQKPVLLLEYLIKTYTNKGMLVLDNTMGSGSTGVACKNLNRRFIGIEINEKYYGVARRRVLDE